MQLRDSVAATRDRSLKPDGIHSVDKRSQAKEDKVYQGKSDVADAKDRRVRRRTGACYICGGKRHYQPSCPLRRHRDSLSSALWSCREWLQVQRTGAERDQEQEGSKRQAKVTGYCG